MSKRKTVKPEELVPGFYVAFNSDLGMVGFFKVKDHSDTYTEHGYHDLDPICVWGLSRYRGRIAYRTLGIPLKQWLERQEKGVQFRRDFDRTDWPMIS